MIPTRRGGAPLGGRLGVAAGTEVAALAGEGEQVLVGAGVAADAGEAVLDESAGEEPLDDRGDDGAPRAVGGGEPLVVDQAQVPGGVGGRPPAAAPTASGRRRGGRQAGPKQDGRPRLGAAAHPARAAAPTGS